MHSGDEFKMMSVVVLEAVRLYALGEVIFIFVAKTYFQDKTTTRWPYVT